jgi:hypothetical protein
MNNVGENLISDLLQSQVGQLPGCPVVLVGHCVGGLVIKELCLKANDELHFAGTSRAKKLENFINNIRGIFYYNTPHLGIRNIGRVSHLRRSPLLKFFETLSTDAALLNKRFGDLSRKHSKWIIEGVGESRVLPSVRMLFATIHPRTMPWHHVKYDF